MIESLLLIVFTNEPFIKFNCSVAGQDENQFDIAFRTHSNSGLILWLNKGSTVKADYLALAISDGYLELSFNLGKQKELLIIRSSVRVDDGHWHTATVHRKRRLGVLQVDNQVAVTGTSEMGATELNTDGILWVGGHVTLPTGLPKSYYQGFVGCIRDFKTDSEVVSLTAHLTNSAATSMRFCHDG